MSEEIKKWNGFANACKNKKRKAGKVGEEKPKGGVGSTIVIEGEMIVQRLSNIATGKSMKYERIGPQEFVTYPYDELSLENMKKASLNHFKSRLNDDDMEADILASQNGPSCSKLSHLKNFKVIFVRFILSTKLAVPSSSLSVSSVSILQTLEKAKEKQSLPTPPLKPVSTNYPKSISITKMMKLGTEISMTIKAPDKIDLIHFDVNEMKWGHPQPIELFVEKNYFAQGGFRSVHKAATANGKAYVVKKFRPEILLEIGKINEMIHKKETEVSLAKKAVQMHNLAKSMTDAFNKHIDISGKREEFGSSFTYNQIFLGILKNKDDIENNGETVVVEEFIEGEFFKYVNNNGELVHGTAENLEVTLKAQCLCHYSYIKSDKNLCLLDIQGAGMTLFDPEIATSEDALADGCLKFCMGNMSNEAIQMFTSAHMCNLYCNMLGFLPLKNNSQNKVA